MPTMSHTPEQRKAWHASKRTQKQRRALLRARKELLKSFFNQLSKR